MSEPLQEPMGSNDPIMIKIDQAINTAREMDNKDVECCLLTLKAACISGKDTMTCFTGYCQIFNMAHVWRIEQRQKDKPPY